MKRCFLKKSIVFFVTAAVLFVALAMCLVACGGNEIATGSEAIKTAKEYVYEKYEQDFFNYSISVELEDGVWLVSFAPEHQGALEFGGGGPLVKIQQSDGTVISCKLQK